MSRNVRAVITTLNIAISILVSEVIVRYVFWDIGMFRIFVVSLAMFICVYKWIYECEEYYIQKEGKRRDEREKGRTERAGAKDDVKGIPWYEMRYSKTGERNRDTRGNIKTI